MSSIHTLRKTKGYREICVKWNKRIKFNIHFFTNCLVVDDNAQYIILVFHPSHALRTWILSMLTNLTQRVGLYCRLKDKDKPMFVLRKFLLPYICKTVTAYTLWWTSCSLNIKVARTFASSIVQKELCCIRT